MRVAMVTPMSPESAIADVMLQAVPYLSATWDLEVWCPTEPAYRPCPAPVRPFVEPDSDVLHELSTFDLVIYVLGNSPWHSRILPLAHSLPGLVVMHDVALTDLVRQAAMESGEIDQLVRRVEAEHGSYQGQLLRDASPRGGPSEWLTFSAEVPLDDVALQGSLGVVVHSAWHAGKVDGLSFGDVSVAALPVPSARVGFEVNQSDGVARLLDRVPADELLVVTVGAVNANRRIDLLIEAIAGEPALAERVHLWAVGPSEAKLAGDLTRLARSSGLGDRFVITGRVTDALLQDVLARADIAAALRDPVLEGQSASVLTQLLSGTPVLVYDHAHYAELPDDVATKVDPTRPLESLRAELLALVSDDEARVARGERGRDYVLTTRSGEAYAEGLLVAGERAPGARPRAHLATDLSARLRRLDLNTVPAVTETVTDLAFELFDLD